MTASPSGRRIVAVPLPSVAVTDPLITKARPALAARSATAGGRRTTSPWTGAAPPAWGGGAAGWLGVVGAVTR